MGAGIGYAKTRGNSFTRNCRGEVPGAKHAGGSCTGMACGHHPTDLSVLDDKMCLIKNESKLGIPLAEGYKW